VLLRILLLLIAGWLGAPIPGGPSRAFAAEPRPAHAAVLVLFSSHRLLPANLDAERGLREASPAGTTPGVELFSEFLGAPSFEGELYEARTARYLQDKYAGLQVKAIVALGQGALEFLLRHRQDTFPDVPVVYGGVARDVVNRLALPPGFIGTPLEHDVGGTVDLARQLHPQADRLVVVTGASAWDQAREAEARAAAGRSAPGLKTEYWSGLPMPELAQRLRTLDERTVVFTPGFYRDGTGINVIPLDAARQVAEASAAPVYSIFPTQLGAGVVGGRMTSYVDVGRTARAALDQLLAGTPAAAVGTPARLPAPVQLDWQQVLRWHVDESLVPADAVIHFRRPTFWDLYRQQVLAIAALIGLQAALIVALLIERRQRQRIAADLRASETRTALAAEAAELAIFEWKPDPGLAPERLPEALRSAHPADRERLGSILRSAATSDSAFEVEYRSVDEAGSVGWNALRGRTQGGTQGLIVGVTMDITARKTAELQAASDRSALIHISRTATLGQLSAAIAHQLNQPLAAILGNAETALAMMQRGNVPAQEMKEILADIISDDHRAADVIRRLAALYRKGETDVAPVDLNALIEETLGLIRAELLLRQVTPTLKLEQPSPSVQGSRTQLQQVILNLVLNAADAMVDVPVDQRHLEVRSSMAENLVEVCVTDQGPGIAPENLARVFEPFWTTKSTGLGIGLAICQSIVAAHRGSLLGRNNRSGGASFCFSLPVITTTANREPSHAYRVPGG